MDLHVFRYSFPFRKSFTTGQGTFQHREGLILEMHGKGITALGEAAPLPGFSKEHLPEVWNQLKKYRSQIKKVFENDLSLDALNTFYHRHAIYPSLCFALDTLAVDYLSQQKGIPMQNYLFDNPRHSVPVNGVIPINKTTRTLRIAQKMVRQGWGTLKLKIGTNFNREYRIIHEIRTSFPHIRLRIDANKAWNLNEALNYLQKLDSLNIEYCEEPLTNADSKGLQQLSQTVATPIALDESLRDIPHLESLAPYISVIILKPMLTGSLTKLFAINRLAVNHDNTVVFTTSLESGIGRMMTAVLVAGLGSKKSAHGLDTGRLLKMDVWQDESYINNGSFTLPDRVELGKGYHSSCKDLDPDHIKLIT